MNKVQLISTVIFYSILFTSCADNNEESKILHDSDLLINCALSAKTQIAEELCVNAYVTFWRSQRNSKIK